MSTYTSGVPTLIPNLVALLDARPGLAGVQITPAPVDLSETEPESIQIDNTEPTREWAALGRQAREEEFYLGFTVSVVVAGGDRAAMLAALLRVYALLAEIEVALRADPSVGGAVHVAHVARTALTQIPTPEGRMAILECEIKADKRLVI